MHCCGSSENEQHTGGNTIGFVQELTFSTLSLPVTFQRCPHTMAETHRCKEETKEYFDAPDVLATKIDTLVGWMRGSKHMIAFTGAGTRATPAA